MVALKRIPKHLRSAKAREWAHKSNEVQAYARMERGIDADTLRKRALDDARGTVVREGCDYDSHGEKNWKVQRSIYGRITQFDLLANGQPVESTGPRNLPLRFRP